MSSLSTVPGDFMKIRSGGSLARWPSRPRLRQVRRRGERDARRIAGAHSANGVDKLVQRHAPGTPPRHPARSSRRAAKPSGPTSSISSWRQATTRSHPGTRGPSWTPSLPQTGDGSKTISPYCSRRRSMAGPAPHVKRRSRSWRGPGSVASTGHGANLPCRFSI
jgi:hypothetical protein